MKVYERSNMLFNFFHVLLWGESGCW